MRLRIILLLGILLLLAFAPLYFAISAFATVSLERLELDAAERLARTEAAHLLALEDQDSALLEASLRESVEAEGLDAVALRERDGSWKFRFGPHQLLTVFENLKLAPTSEQTSLQLHESEGQRLLVLKLQGRGESIYALIKLNSKNPRALALTNLLFLYLLVGGLTLLAIAYLALTRWIVHPIVALEQAAERVAGGGVMNHAPERAPAEIQGLSESLVRMTTRLREEEAALREKIKEVEEATQELHLAQKSLIRSERLASVGRLSAGLAHEVGNPLSAVLGLLELLAADAQSPELTVEERRDFINRMKQETERISKIIHDLLTFARTGAAKGHAPPSSSKIQAPAGKQMDTASASLEQSELTPNADPKSALAALLNLLGPQREFKEITIEQELDPDLPALPLPEEELIQVLLNLFLNAKDALQQNAPESPPAKILIRSFRDATSFGLDVIDNGPGVSPALAETLFEPFVSDKDIGKGTGLGLSVSQGLVEGSGGELLLLPQETGAHFRIQFPLSRGDFESTWGTEVPE